MKIPFISNLRTSVSVKILLGVIFFVFAYNVFSSITALQSIKKSYSELSNIYFNLGHHNSESQLHFSESKSWLNDVAASRGADGFDDGWDFSKENSELFLKDLNDITTLSKTANLPDISKSCSEAEKLFTQYYTAKKKLTETFVKAGPEQGNEGLAEVDKISIKLEKQLKNMDELITLHLNTTQNEFSDNISQALQTLIIDFSILAVGLFLAFAFLFKLMKEQKDNGLHLQDTANKLKDAFDTLAHSANKQAASLEETAAAIEEITGNIKSNSEKSIQMEQISNDTRQIAQGGSELVHESSIAMHAINDSTKNISEAISTIEQIAFQTNILSLNAAVEAATAGDHGRGFAVVAAEVRNLASKSAEAAKKIKELVSIASQKAERGNQISKEITSAFSSMIEKINDTNQMVEEVSNGNKEQLIGMEQISHASNELDQLTQENAKLTQDTNALADELLRISNETLSKI